MKLPVKRWLTFVDQTEGPKGEPPLRKVAIVAVIDNPCAGRYVKNLKPMMYASAQLGALMAEKAVHAMEPHQARGIGKGGVVGLAGEQEHVNALLTTEFAVPVREALGGGKAWISSMTKRGGPGTTIDIPMNHKDALYVRSFYDGMTVTLHDAPAAGEIALILCLMNRGRIDARVGGLRPQDVKGVDGLT